MIREAHIQGVRCENTEAYLGAVTEASELASAFYATIDQLLTLVNEADTSCIAAQCLGMAIAADKLLIDSDHSESLITMIEDWLEWELADRAEQRTRLPN